MRTTLMILSLACASSVATADAHGDMTRIVLPVDQKLVDVAWRCPSDGTCAPWFLTRLMGRNETTRSYTFTGGGRTILVIETRDPGNWPWERVRTMVLPPGQRLLEVGWRCDRDGCVPWFLTSPIEAKRPRTHVLTDGTDVILIEEDRLE